MRVRIVTNHNGRGLQHDADVLEGVLGAGGHDVDVWQYDSPDVPDPADLNLFLEVAPPHLAPYAPRQWLVPNPEWFPHGESLPLTAFDLVLCKTRTALRTFSRLTERVVFLGFAARDRFDVSVLRQRRFLHTSGGSTAKGTSAVLEAWHRFGLDVPLTVVSCDTQGTALPPTVTVLPWLDDASLQQEQNAALWHLCPSDTEGFGHSLHESLSCGAVVARSDFPPLCEWPGLPIRVEPAGKRRLARVCSVAPEALRDAVERCVAMSESEVAAARARSRAWYEAERLDFVNRITGLVDEAR